MQNENLIRLSVFLGIFIIVALAERLAPRRASNRTSRWKTNWALAIIDSLTLRLVAIAVPLLAVGSAIDASSRGIGILNHLNWPIWLEVLISILVLDFAIWLQHLITHKVPILWRLHQVHHADSEMDVTTAIRFHPLEIALSMGLKIVLVYALGPSAYAVVLFEILLNGTALFNHANLKLPSSVDATLRRLIVTPDMHRIHHSIYREEHDSNYGFSLSIWDRIFGTYVASPRDGHISMNVGLKPRYTVGNSILNVLTMPFRGPR